MSDQLEVNEMAHHLPHIQKTWTLGTVLASALSAMSLLSMLGGGVWFTAHLDDSTKNIPSILQKQAEILQKQADSDREIAVLQDQQHYTDARYAEIMAKLDAIQLEINQARMYDHRQDQH